MRSNIESGMLTDITIWWHDAEDTELSAGEAGGVPATAHCSRGSVVVYTAQGSRPRARVGRKPPVPSAHILPSCHCTHGTTYTVSSVTQQLVETTALPSPTTHGLGRGVHFHHLGRHLRGPCRVPAPHNRRTEGAHLVHRGPTWPACSQTPASQTARCTGCGAL